jgi:hypothetical protein
VEVIAGHATIGMVLTDGVCVRGLKHAVQVAFLAPMVNRSDSVWINLAHTGLLEKLLIHLERQGVGRMPIDEDRHGSPPRLDNLPPLGASLSRQGEGRRSRRTKPS